MSTNGAVARRARADHAARVYEDVFEMLPCEENPSPMVRINRLNPDGMEPVLDWLSYFDGFWDERLSALENAIEKDFK